MPHTYSKNKRTKRPDYRPNGKQRRKERQELAKATPVEELMQTRIHSSKRKERPVTGQLKQENIEDDHPDRKRSRALQKLLRQIQVLAEKETAGEALDEAQRKKLGRFDAVLEELEELMELEQPKQEDGSDEDGEESEIEDEKEDEFASDDGDEKEEVVPEIKSKSKTKSKRRATKENDETSSSSRRRKTKDVQTSKKKLKR